jgi:signal transduction histidine kinase
VTLSVTQPGRQECVVTITDNGIGIPADFQSSIFLPFKRLHGREIPGSGLGLPISKRIVEAHGGRMWVESTPEAGARFCFTLRPFESGATAP